MAEAHRLETEKQEMEQQKRNTIIKKIVELEQSLQDTPDIGSTPVVLEHRKLRRHRAFLEIPGTDDELIQVDNGRVGDNDARMDMDESDGGEVKGSEEEATEFEDDRPKKKVKIADSVAKGAVKGTQPSAAKDAAKEGAKNDKQGRKRGKNKVTRTAIDEARDQIARKRMELEAEEADDDQNDRDQREPETVAKSGGNKARHVSHQFIIVHAHA